MGSVHQHRVAGRYQRHTENVDIGQHRMESKVKNFYLMIE